VGSVIVTTESSIDGATLSRTNFSGYVAHVTIFLNAHCCVLFSSRVIVW